MAKATKGLNDRAFLPGSVTIDVEPNRNWENIFGEQKEAQLFQYFGANVILRVDEGVIAVPISTLSPVDLDYLKSVLKGVGQLELLPGRVSPNEESSKLVLDAHQWARQLKSWSEAVESQDREPAELAWNSLRGVRDPQALGTLIKQLAKEQNPSVAVACVEAIAAIGGPEATAFLVKAAVTDQRVPVVTSATWALKQLESSMVATALDEYAKLLRNETHRASAISSLFVTGISTAKTSQSVVHPELTKSLITMLIVKQPEFVPVVRWSGFKNQLGSSRHWHLRAEGSTVKIEHEIPFASALDLLIKHTRQDYGYDQRAWRSWYDRENNPPNSAALAK